MTRAPSPLLERMKDSEVWVWTPTAATLRGSPPNRSTNAIRGSRPTARGCCSRYEELTWRGQDGTAVEGLLYYPPDYRPGQRYPLLVFTHGGPAASDPFGFAEEAQVYAGKGYARASLELPRQDRLGDALPRDMIKGYFKQAHLDALAGADAVIAMGLADEERQVKKGWSAGGHMTNKLVAPRAVPCAGRAGMVPELPGERRLHLEVAPGDPPPQERQMMQ